jgi:hypothetical protein
MSSSPTLEGLLPFPGPTNLVDGFTGTFTSRYVDARELRMHAVIGGEGPPLLLVPGWAQTWYAWPMLIPALARDFEVIAVDPRGIAPSDRPPTSPSSSRLRRMASQSSTAADRSWRRVAMESTGIVERRGRQAP